MTNNTANNIGIALMLLFVIVIDCIVFDIMHEIDTFNIWFIVMMVPATLTAVALFFTIKHFELDDKLKDMFNK